jgi:hypothetical protein
MVAGLALNRCSSRFVAMLCFLVSGLFFSLVLADLKVERPPDHQGDQKDKPKDRKAPA